MPLRVPFKDDAPEGAALERVRSRAPLLVLAACALLPGAAPRAAAATAFPSTGDFSVTYSFTTSTPASPVDVGEGRDLTVNRYLATMANDGGSGFLHVVAGQCMNIRFTQRDKRTIDTNAYCQFKDGDGDTLYARYTTGGEVPMKAIVNHWTFTGGTGKYDGVQGQATDSNSGNLAGEGTYQASGKMKGSYKIVRKANGDESGTHD